MKHFLTLLALLLSFTTSVAQETEKKRKREPITAYRRDKDKVKHRKPQLLQLSYGYRSGPQLLVKKIVKDRSAEFSSSSLRFNGPYILDMHGFLGKKWSGGMICALDKMSGRFEQKTDTATKFVEFSTQLIVLLPYFAYHWHQGDRRDLYSGAGLGYGFGSYSDHGNWKGGGIDEAFGGFTFQLTAAGIRFGKTIGAFAEVGYGDLGIVRAGISGRFNPM